MANPMLAPYPATRLRRMRQAPWIRDLVRETVLTPADLIWSMVVHEGEGRIPVASLPGVERLSVAEAAKAAVEARALGIPAIAIFPHIDGARKGRRGLAGLGSEQHHLPGGQGHEGRGPRGRDHVRRGAGPLHQPRP